ncbi:hypothetical protein [Pseudonocardia alni]|uniref:hypothetical protein n=1 Tax=Pseudonocardia alni TaxID=33907 RepID=UPI0033216461
MTQPENGPSDDKATQDEVSTETKTEKTNGPDSSLDDLLAGLDEDARTAVRAQLRRARDEAARYRTRSKEFADDATYERAKTAMAKLDEVENAAKTEAQRERDAREAAEKARDEARTELLRERVGRKHKLPDSFVELLRGTDEDAMSEHAEALAAELEKARGRPADHVPKRSKPSGSPGSDDSDQFDPEQIATAALRGF